MTASSQQDVAFLNRFEARRRLCGLGLALILAGCTSTLPDPGKGRANPTDSGPLRIPDGVLTQPDPVPRDEPLSASGNSLSYVVLGKRYHRLNSARNFDQTGVASWYGRKFHGRLTASGEPYDMFGMTAAHKSIPLPTYARVTNLVNQRSVIVRINDRGPFVDDRLIDLSYAAAAKLDMLKKGTANVRVVALSGTPAEGGQPAAPLDIQTAAAPPPTVPASVPTTATSPAPIYVKPYTDPQPILNLPAEAVVTVPAIVAQAPAPAVSRPQPVLLASSEGRYLQIGAYQSYATADELRARIDGGVAGDVFISKLPSDTFYRVRVGPFATAADLAAARAILRERHAIDAIVVAATEASPTCC